ncbi:MAG: GAF domain-containing protein [Acidobacteriaceae bacterium]|nr:GAF domain-containing protein [Acidobacteriaceae bacterium]
MHTLTPLDSATSKPELYQQICGQLHNLLGSEKNFAANAANTAALLFHSLPDVNWVGFYLVEGEELVLGPFQGKPACVRIPFGKGVCGTAAAQQRSVIVPDVSKYPGHIVCDPNSKSELVVPLLNWGKLLGVLDLDSSSLNRFDEDDCEGIESVASVFVASQATDDLPDLSAAAAEWQSR